MTLKNKARILIIAVIAAAVSLPFVIPNTYYLSNVIFIFIHSIAVIGLCLLMGYAGQVSLGHAAFYGMGAYGSAVFTVKAGFSPLFAMCAAACVTGIAAFFIGLPALKLKEHFLALATLGSGVIVFIFFNEQGNLTGGPSGFSGIPYFSIFGFEFSNDVSYYYLTLCFIGLAVWFAWNIVNSRTGRALTAIHSSEIGAKCMGIPARSIKIQIFILSAVYASIAGSLYVHYVTFISPSPFGFGASVEFVVMAVVGGLASIWGPLFGVAAVILLTEGLRTIVPYILPHAGGEYEIIFFGLILMTVMIFMPEGLTGGLKQWWAKRNAAKKLTKTPESPRPDAVGRGEK